MITQLFSIFMAGILMTCGTKSTTDAPNTNPEPATILTDTAGMKKAYFASGCFWCVEAVFESVIGVGEVVSGYCGGSAEDANYEKVSAGFTKHAETVMVYYNPNLIKYGTLLEVFFDSHDPTTLHRQGPDRGYQYRSAVFYTNEEEKKLAEDAILSINNSKVYTDPVTTEVVPLIAFYPAEDYHQNFERLNPNQGYVKSVSIPRLKKFQNKRPELLKKKE